MKIKHGEEVNSAVKRSAAGVAFSHAGRRSFLPAEVADFYGFFKNTHYAVDKTTER